MSTLLGDARIRIRPDLTGFESAAQRSVGGAFKRVAAVASATLAAVGVAAFAKSTLDIGREYQNSLNTLQAVSSATTTQLAAVSKTAKQLGSDISLPATSAADAAVAMTELAKGGLSVDSAMKAAKGTLQLAAAAQIDAGKAAEYQAQTLNAFHLQADQAGRVADVLANAANAASGEIGDFALGMSQASAVAASTGISLEDTAATLGVLANNGIKGSDAGTLLKSALLALQSPSKPAKAAMDDLSLSAYDAQGNFVGLSSIFGQLQAAQKKMTPEMYAMATSTLFGSDAARLAGIAGHEGADGFDAMAQAMGRSGSAADVAAAKAKGVGGAIEAFKSQVETFQIDLFERGAPNIEKLVRYAADKFPAIGDALIGGVENAIGFLGEMKDKGVAAFKAVREYVAPLTSELDDLWTSITATNGPAEILFNTLKGGAGIVLGLFKAAHPLVSVAGDLLGLFTKLPGPVQAVVLALAALKIATSTDLLGRLSGRNGLSGAVGKAGESLVGFAQTARVNMRLAGDEVGGFSRTAGGLTSALASYFPKSASTVRNSMADITSSFGQAKQAHREFVTQLHGSDAVLKGTGDLAGFSSAAKTAATKGIGALRSAGSGLVGFLGGPWGVAMTGAAVGVGLITSAISDSKEQAQGWTEALSAGGAAAVKAQQEMKAQRNETDDFKVIGQWVGENLGLVDSIEDVTKANRDNWKSLSPIPQAQSKVSEWTNTLSYRLETLGANNEKTRTAQERLSYWTDILKDRQTDLANATGRTNDVIVAQTQAALAASNADVAASMAQTSLTKGMDEYRKSIADGTLSALDHTQASDEMAQQAIQTANAVAEQAKAHSAATTDEGKQMEADRALLDSLKATAQQLGKDTPKAITDLIKSLSASTGAASITEAQMKNLGFTVLGMPDEHHIEIEAPTEDQKKRLEELGVITKTLPNGNIIVEADTGPATATINALVAKMNAKWIVGYNTANAREGFSGRKDNAIGRIIHAYADGGLEPMQGGIADVVAPNTWRVIGDRVTDDEAYIPINNSPRSRKILATTAARMGYGLSDSRFLADGAVLGTYTMPVDIDPAHLGDLEKILSENLGIGQAGSGSVGGLWQNIFTLVKSAFPLARVNSAYRPGDPGYHGKGKAVDLGFGSGPGGAGSAGLAAIAAFLYKGYGRNLAELIYDGIGDNTPDLKNGRDHTYDAATRAMHANHVHAAVYDQGGILEPGMTGVNRSGKPEAVFNNDQWGVLERIASGGGNTPLIGGNLVLQVDPNSSITDQMGTAMHELRRLKRGGRGR